MRCYFSVAIILLQPTAGLALWTRRDVGHVRVQGHILDLFKVRVSKTYSYNGNSIGSRLAVLGAIPVYSYYWYSHCNFSHCNKYQQGMPNCVKNHAMTFV